MENTFSNNPVEEYIGIIYEKMKNISLCYDTCK